MTDCSLYVHIPFCRSKCIYCDFNSIASRNTDVFHKYLLSLKAEIDVASKSVGQEISSVYFGGGTPSCLADDDIADLIAHVRNAFTIKENAEITFECNPESVTESKLQVLSRFGVNRISLGLQSLYDDNLKRIGRIHTANDGRVALEKIRRYFDNLSVDFIVGLPYDTKDRIIEEIEQIAPLVTHVSVYTLQVEDGTPLCRQVESGKIILPDDDATIDLLHTAIDTLAKCGFERYEVSNFAKNGKISNHNYGYWTGIDYVGVGAGASSFSKDKRIVDNFFDQSDAPSAVRYKNARKIEDYVVAVENAVKEGRYPLEKLEYELVTATELNEERIFLGLRTAEGIDASILNDDQIALIMGKYAEYFDIKTDKIALNGKGMDIMNYILAEIL